jgi:GH25 family lysozyme M1 (1,4-beta-N-acetylmuramidase)
VTIIHTQCMFDQYHGDSMSAPNYVGDVALYAMTKSAGQIALVHKLSQGVNFPDNLAIGRISAAIKAGLLVGGYHYLDIGVSVASQVALFMHQVGMAWQIVMSSGGPQAFPLVLDFEPDDASVGSATTLAASQFVEAVQSVTGVWPMLYTGRWDIAPNVKSTKLPACPLWLSEYGDNSVCPPGWSNWAWWQWTDGTTGPHARTLPGVGTVDQSAFAGTAMDALAWWMKYGATWTI